MRKKILIADDSSTVRLMEKMILAREPYDLVFAQDGKEAAEKAASERPDLVLLDLMMPQMNGFEVLRRLREQDATRALPVIIISTRGEAANIELGRADGCDDYLTKPIDAGLLLTKVRQHLGP